VEPIANIVGFDLSVSTSRESALVTVAITKGSVLGQTDILDPDFSARSLAIPRETKARRVRIILVPESRGSSITVGGRRIPVATIHYSAAFDSDHESKRGYYADGLIVVGHVEVPGMEDQQHPQLTPKVNALPHHWPWGSHETELLRHLAAAAQQFWALYDSADPSTAPRNEDVVTWLKRRGVADRNAQVMATMLRADRLPAGPRK